MDASSCKEFEMICAGSDWGKYQKYPVCFAIEIEKNRRNLSKYPAF
jgi:hypothetical protein